MRIRITAKVKQVLLNENYRGYNFNNEFPDNTMWDHQVRVIEKCLLVRRSIVEAYVSSGKTAVFGKLVEILLRNKDCKKALIIVPLQQLVDQTAEEIADRTTLQARDVCTYYAGQELKDRKVTISTWQSLNFVTGKLKKEKEEKVKELAKKVDLLICDEVHTAKADVVNKIIVSFKKCKYKHGFTGTLPKDKYERTLIKSAFGTQVASVTPQELTEKKLISEAKIFNLYLKYPKEFVELLKTKEYDKMRLELFKKPSRLKVLASIVERVMKNTLILVNNVEDEGSVLQEYLARHIDGKEIVFLSGKYTSLKERQRYVKEAEKRDDLVLIATYGIFKMGISVRNIHNLIFASSVKSFIAVRQTLGRGLRQYFDKTLRVYNLIDEVPKLRPHGNKRKKIFEEDGFKSEDKKIDLR
jgi:superfamily II DNA or RNA helicase